MKICAICKEILEEGEGPISDGFCLLCVAIHFPELPFKEAANAPVQAPSPL